MGKPASEHTEIEDSEQDGDEVCVKIFESFHCNKLAAGHASFEQMKLVSGQSKLRRFDDEIHSVSWPMIRKKSLLGQGAFSLVYKVQVSMNEDTSNEKSLDRKKYYALKHIKPDITEDSKDFRIAATDLAVEGEILSRLRHENIIKLHGVYAGDPKTAYLDYQYGYFLLIDVLEDTLTRRLEKMRRMVKKKRRSSIPSILERIGNIALGIAKGLEYLHENGVILRDLKPDNVGFDENGTPVIFDLGFARELHTVHKSEVAGSLRYMSPEMGLSQGATLASDVYSFGVLLYELCTLEKPFKEYKGRSEFIQGVLIKNYRPDLAAISSKAIADLISKCWDRDQTNRPSMKRVGNVLRVETALLDRQQMSISRRRCSGHSMSSMASPLPSSAFGSLGSFRPSSRNSGRRMSSNSIPACPTNSSSSDVKNSFARRSSIIRKMSNQNFDWNTPARGEQDYSAENNKNKVFGKTHRHRNSLTSSILERRRKKNSGFGSNESLASLNSLKESCSRGSIIVNDIEAGLSCDPAMYRRPSYSRSASNDSIASYRSISGESCHTSYSTDMSVSNFTLGELKPRRMGGSRRSSFNTFFQSFSAKDLFSSEMENTERDRGFVDHCIEETPSRPNKHEADMVKPEQIDRKSVV